MAFQINSERLKGVKLANSPTSLMNY